MSTNFNDKREKHGNKLRKVNFLTNFMMNKIDNNQEIKRFVLYGTNNPLGKRGQDLNGTIISQPDITDSLVTKNALFNDPFDQNILDTEKVCYIFIYPYSATFKKDDIGDLEFVVNILSPSEYNNLTRGDKRIFEIGYRIEDLLDQYVIENNEGNYEIGNVMFDLTNSAHSRLSKVTSIENLALKFKVRISTMRNNF